MSRERPPASSGAEDELPADVLAHLESEARAELEQAEGARRVAEAARDYSPTSAARDRLESRRQEALASGRLDLDGFRLLELDPDLLVGFEGITELVLSGNGLRTLPPELARLTKLHTLDLTENDFVRLPAVVHELPELRHLQLSGNPSFAGFSPETFRALPDLVVLAAAGCSIDEIPPEIGGLGSLRSLLLGTNLLTSLPAELGRCRRLRTVDLAANPLGEVPGVLTTLPALTALHLGNCGIAELPAGIGSLTSLEVLELSDNQLTGLPVEIGALAELTDLELDRNRLTGLPASLGRLGKLRRLSVPGNLLTALPEELGQLPFTLNLDLWDNPWNEPLPALVVAGTKSVLSYLRSLIRSTPQYEAKLVLVGEGGVGKSSLVAALRGDSFVANRPTTHGIELGVLNVAHPDLPDVRIQLNTWDFGGQEVYRITHQFFFSRRALYLLAWKPREGQEQNSIEEWCRRIRLRVGDEARVIVVATHADERRPELDYPLLKSRFPDMVVGNFAIDSESGRGVAELQEAIAAEAARLPQMGELIANEWTAARTAVARTGRPYISRRHFERLCFEAGLDETAVETLAVLLHDLGHVVHYSEDEGLRDLVVLQPEWLTKAIGFVLEHEETRAAGGVLQHERLLAIWAAPEAPDEPGYPRELHPYFLRLMEKFDITYRLPDEAASLVAQLVPYERPVPLEWAGIARDQTTRRLRLICRMSEEAPGLIAWLTVLNHRFSVGRHWRRGVLLVHREYASQGVIELGLTGRDVVLTVLGPAPEYFFHLLRDGMEDLIRRRWKGLTHQFLIPCGRLLPGGQGCGGYFSYHALVKFRQRNESRILCQSCVEWSDVSSLLTGFAQQEASVQELLLEMHELQGKSFRAIQGLQAQAAHGAGLLRATLKVLSEEVSDTPRLFTFYPDDRNRVVRTISTRQYFVLHLWCEEPGREHPVPGARYTFRPTKEWVQLAGPYVRVVARILGIAVPVAGGVYAVTLDAAELAEVKAQLELTKVLAEKFPEPAELTINDFSSDEVRLSRAEGAGLRALRHLLLKLDPASGFGGLRRVRAPSADLLYVCAEHHRAYDPGLPDLGYGGSAGAGTFPG